MGAAWLLRRLLASVAIIFAVVTFVFILIHVAPGRPCPETVERAVCEELKRQFGLDRPLPEQYWRYLVALAHGHMGNSYANGRPVRAAIAGTIPFTLQLAGAALVLDFLLGLGLGIYQAVRVNRIPDVVLGNVTLFIYSLPTFWLALLLLLAFGEKLRWFPVGGASDPVLCPVVHSLFCVADRLWHTVLPAATLGLVGAAGTDALKPRYTRYALVADRLWHTVLPAATLGLVGAAGTARFQRAAMLEVARQDYVRTARAKGLPERRVVLRHQLRNALLSVITRFGMTLPFLLTGAVLVETIFACPGMG